MKTRFAISAALVRAAARVRALHRQDSGTAAISFVLCLPIFLVIVGIIVQFALIANAKLMVTDAAAKAARAAMTSLPDDAPENVKKAACFALVPVSPKSKGQTNDVGQQIYDALVTNGVAADPTFPARYAYAAEAATVTYPNDQYKQMHGHDIDVTVQYEMLMTVPVALLLSKVDQAAAQGGTDKRQIHYGTVAGVTGYFYTVTSTVRVQTAHGRAAADWRPVP